MAPEAKTRQRNPDTKGCREQSDGLDDITQLVREAGRSRLGTCKQGQVGRMAAGRQAGWRLGAAVEGWECCFEG